MKKLLIFMLVLGMASLASAQLQISVNGNKEPMDSEYVLIAPSGTLTLDIWTTHEIAPPPGTGEGYFAMVAQESQATISGGIVVYPLVPPMDEGIMILDDVKGMGGFPGMVEGENGVTGGIALTRLPNIPAGATIYDGILFHCEGPGDVTIHLLWTVDFMTGVVIDSVTIHQMPEPATIALLGLGGLLLRRRK